MNTQSAHLTYIKKNKDRFLSELFEFLRIPSVCYGEAYRGDVLRAAEWVKDALATAGAEEVQVLPTEGNPVVYGEKILDPRLPTILVYGHYDVQPAEPLELWKTDPFDPVIKDDIIYARGATDDKGQLHMHIKAFEMMLATDTLPCNLKFVIEGEEEMGSVHFEDFCKKHKKLLKADSSIVSDSYIPSKKIPIIETGTRGLCYFEMRVETLDNELHSGIYGGAVPNAVKVITDMLASLHDAKGRVNVAHFYDDATPLSKKERALIAKLPYNEKAYRKEAANARALETEDGYSAYECTMVRPTLELHGIQGGFTAPGAKTIVPAHASAKFSVRLVAGQDPVRISKLILAHIKRIAPKSARVEVQILEGMAKAYALPIESLAYKAAELAMKDTFGVTPLARRCGGSIGALTSLSEIVGVQPVALGFGFDDDGYHGPNEHFGVWNYLKGIETIPRFFEHYVALSRSAKKK